MSEQTSVSVIEEAVNQFLKSVEHAESFSADDAVAFVTKNTPLLKTERKERIVRDVELILESRQDLFFKAHTHNAVCWNRAPFFKGTQIKILPSKLEIKDGILLYGARFAPFCSDELFADEYRLSVKGTGKTLPVVTYTAQLGQIARTFMLLGRSVMLDCIVAESSENYEALKRASSPEKAMVAVSAFDLGSFYKENNFTEGDAIIATVEDWRSGVFSLEYRAKDELPDRAALDAFLTQFEEAIIQTCEDYGEYLEIPDQIAHAYLCAFTAGHDLRKKPYLSLDEYPSMMRDVAIRRDDADWVLVPLDELATAGESEDSREPEHEHEHDHDHGECSCRGAHAHSGGPEKNGELRVEDFSASAGKLDSVDSILEEVNAPLSHTEIYAMIVDDIANGQDSFEVFYGKLRDIMGVKFVDDAQEVTFQNFVEDNWEEAVAHFNPVIEEPKMPLRTRLLELNDQRIECSRSLLERYRGKEIPPHIVHRMKSFHAKILNTLRLLNADSALPEGEEYDMLELRVGDIEEEWEAFQEELEKNTDQ